MSRKSKRPLGTHGRILPILMKTFRTIAVVLGLAATTFAFQPEASAPVTPAVELWRDVEVIRTAHGVPHIRAANLRAGAYALAWVQCEDYGPRTPMRLLEARGLSARILGRAALDANFEALRDRTRAVATYHLLDPE